jgi:sodium/hydrogen exchanger-like protein 6/7
MLINWFIRYRARRRGKDAVDELPYSYQAMLFWAGLRGAVGVALATGMSNGNAASLKATVLVVVVLTVIIFGGTTARMLEILGIQTGIVEEIDSDDEFDIEAVSGNSYYKRSGTGIGNLQRRQSSSVPLNHIGSNGHRSRGFASGNATPMDNRASSLNRKGSSASANGNPHEGEQGLLGRSDSASDEDMDSDTSDLPPAARRSDKRTTASLHPEGDTSGHNSYPTSGTATNYETRHITASSAINSLLHGTSDDHAAWFRQLDEGFIKPKLLLDGGRGPHGGPSA